MCSGARRAHNNFEQMNYPEIFIFNYRFVPKKVREKLDALMRDRDNPNEKKRNAAEIRIKRINHALNQLNIELHRAIRQEDNSFVSRTILESTRYAPQNIVVLRSLTINPLTTPDILREIIDEQNRLGMKIYKNEFEKQLENL
jgi:glutamate decarboxylase